MRKFDQCRLLVFGLGNDTPFWNQMNSEGRSTFLEDDRSWFEKITQAFPSIEAYLVAYPL
jgi:hypothetical protein